MPLSESSDRIVRMENNEQQVEEGRKKGEYKN